MNSKLLYDSILSIYKTLEITAFPIDCFDVMRKLGFKIVKYSELSNKKKYACQKLSRDACLIKDTLFYDESTYPRRVAFSIGHELGHYFLETDAEDEADEFASHFLAPRILIHKYGYRNADKIHDHFGLSYAAANRALSDYRIWKYMNRFESELQLQNIFFPPKEVKREEETSKNHTELSDETEEAIAFFDMLSSMYDDDIMCTISDNRWAMGY